jgi:hypothetical protein
MSEDPEERERKGLPTHIPTPDTQSGGNPVIGSVLSFISIVLLAFILRLAVPKEDSAIELGILLVAIGFAQIWLIFNFLKSFRK